MAFKFSAIVLTVWLAGFEGHSRMMGHSFLSGARTAQTFGVAAILVHRVHSAALLGNVLMHLGKGDTWHGGCLLVKLLELLELLN